MKTTAIIAISAVVILGLSRPIMSEEDTIQKSPLRIDQLADSKTERTIVGRWKAVTLKANGKVSQVDPGTSTFRGDGTGVWFKGYGGVPITWRYIQETGELVVKTNTTFSVTLVEADVKWVGENVILTWSDAFIKTELLMSRDQ